MMEMKHVPRLIFWELTAQCNLKCVHCRAVAMPEKMKGELSTAEIFKIIDDIAKLYKPILVLTGGEPLYREDIFDIASHAVSKGLRVALATNGTLIDERIAKKIKDAGILRVAISIDGGDANVHDSFRGIPGSFDAAMNGLKFVKKAGVETQINSTIAKHNVHQVADIFNLALGMKVNALHYFMLVPVGCGVMIADSEMLPAQQYEEVLNWLYDQFIAHKDIELKATCAPHYYRIIRQRAKQDGIKLSFETHGMAAMTKGCLAGSAVAFISRLGVVQPCGYLPAAAGNLKKQTFEDVWEHSKIFHDMRDPSLLKDKCGACEYRAVCAGCRARAYYQTGDYLDEEPYCIYVPEGYEPKSKKNGIKISVGSSL
jgi:heme b synthase